MSEIKDIDEDDIISVDSDDSQFEIDFGEITDINFKSFLNCTNLESISATNVDFYFLYNDINIYNHIKQISLFLCRMKDDDFKILFSKCPSLNNIGLVDCFEITIKTLRSITKYYTELDELYLSCSNLKKKQIKKFLEICKEKNIIIVNFYITDKYVEEDEFMELKNSFPEYNLLYEYT
jgi:hypothetical protein